MRLCDGELGGTYRVEEICLAMQMERRLEALGLTPGGFIEIMNKKPRGALVVKFRGSRFAIGRKMAENIQVREVLSK